MPPQANSFPSACCTPQQNDTQINWMEEQTDQSINVWWECSNISFPLNISQLNKEITAPLSRLHACNWMDLVTAQHNHIIFHRFPFGISWTLMISLDAELSQPWQQVFFFFYHPAACVGLHALTLLRMDTYIFHLKAVLNTVHYRSVNSLLSLWLQIIVNSLKLSCVHQICPTVMTSRRNCTP